MNKVKIEVNELGNIPENFSVDSENPFVPRNKRREDKRKKRIKNPLKKFRR